MKTIKGPALFLAQFAGDAAPFNSWDAITRWAADCGYKGVQVPSWDARFIDLEKTRRLPFRSMTVRRDLDSLQRHAKGWSRTDRLRFYLAYRNEKKLSPCSKRLLKSIIGKRKR